MNGRLFALALLGFFATAVVTGCGGTRNVVVDPAANDPSVVAVIDGTPLTLDDFEERFARTAGSREAAADSSMGSYVDFLERYVNFRLKVLAAREAGLDRDPGVLQEIESYRSNLARPYLIEREVLDPLVREVYDRRQEVLDVSHILLRVAENAPPGDTLEAYRTLDAIRDSIVAGADFADMAIRHSQDPSARRPGPGYGGRLGYVSGGRLVKEFEDVAYATPTGAVSEVFRSNFGYHILRVEERRPAEAPIHVAHIMIVPDAPTSEDTLAAWETIEDLKAQIADGADFADLAREYSRDSRTARSGGVLPELTLEARIPPSFVHAAYSLREEGDVSDVVETDFGLHLIRLLERGALPTYDEAYETIKADVVRLPRAAKAEERFAKELWTTYDGTVDTAAVYMLAEEHGIDSLLSWTSTGTLSDSIASLPVAKLGDSTYTSGAFWHHVLVGGGMRADAPRSAIAGAVGRFASEKALLFETAALEERNPEFARVMTEFREGLVLFSLMEDSVWSAAAQDSLALQAHFELRRDQYRFPERTRVLALYSRSDSLLREAASRLDAGMSFSEVQTFVLADTLSGARVDTVRLAEPTSSIFDQALTLDPGDHLGPMRHNRDWVLLLNDGVEPARARTFDEARASVLSEYQDIVEAALIERLRDRYRVSVHPERLEAAFRSEASTATTTDQSSAR